MRRGLNGAGEWALLVKNKQNKNYPKGEKQDRGLARLGRTRQGRAGYNQGNINDELARDCKHKEIKKGANEEGNEENTGGAN